MDEGYRYFGVIIGNQLVCHAGITRIFKKRSEIIAVRTILEADRNNGYAFAYVRI